MRPKSHTLFHFTKNKETLQKILAGGFWPRYCLEDIEWVGFGSIEFLAFPMVCFCDIPLSRIDEHVEFYGQFGLGLNKDWALRNGLNPVFYISAKNISEQNTISNALFKLMKPSVIMKDADKKRDFIVSLRHLHGYLKPVEGRMVINDKSIRKEFYLESEWRQIPLHPQIRDFLHRTEFEDIELLEKENSKTHDLCSLQFLPSDVKYIFVPTDSEILDIVQYIQTELNDLKDAEQKLLMSRVISLDSIRADL